MHFWYRRDDSGWAEDDGPAPIWREDAPIVKSWVDDYLLPRLTTPPNGLAVQIVTAVDDPSLAAVPLDDQTRLDRHLGAPYRRPADRHGRRHDGRSHDRQARQERRWRTANDVH